MAGEVAYMESIASAVNDGTASTQPEAVEQATSMRREVQNLKIDLEGEEAHNQQLDSIIPAASTASGDVEMADVEPNASAKSAETETGGVGEGEAHAVPKNLEIQMEGYSEDHQGLRSRRAGE